MKSGRTRHIKHRAYPDGAPASWLVAITRAARGHYAQPNTRTVSQLIAVVIGAALLAVASGTGVTAANAVTASASDPGWSAGTGVFMMTYGSGLCLDATLGLADIETCNGLPEQKWKVRAVTTVTLDQKYTAYQLVNGDEICIGLSGTTDASGTQAVGINCSKASTHPRQDWIPLPAVSDSPYLRWSLANGKSGLFLAAKNNDLRGSSVHEYNLNKAPSTFGLIFTGKK